MNLPKIEENDREDKNDANTLPLLLSGQVSRTSDSSHLFWNLEDPVCASSNTILRIDFFQKQISTQDVGLITCI